MGLLPHMGPLGTTANVCSNLYWFSLECYSDKGITTAPKKLDPGGWCGDTGMLSRHRRRIGQVIEVSLIYSEFQPAWTA